MNDATKFPFQITDGAGEVTTFGPLAPHEREPVQIDQLLAALSIAGAELERARSTANEARTLEAAALSVVNDFQERITRSLELVRMTQPSGTNWKVRGTVAPQR